MVVWTGRQALPEVDVRQCIALAFVLSFPVGIDAIPAIASEDMIADRALTWRAGIKPATRRALNLAPGTCRHAIALLIDVEHWS